MAPPIYFFAKRSASDVVDGDRLRPEVLAAHLLESSLGDVTSVSAQTWRQDLTARGPGDASGFMLGVIPVGGELPKRTGYLPDFQTWRLAHRTADGHELWIGLDNESPVAPRDVLRSNAQRGVDGFWWPRHAGYPLTLGDGNEWICPIIRRPPVLVNLGQAATPLPTDIGFNAAGEFVEELKPAYRQLWEEAGHTADAVFDEEGRIRTSFSISVEVGMRRAVAALALNYRLGLLEATALRLLDRTTVWSVLGATVDAAVVARFFASQKKTSDTSATPSTTPGSADSTLSTAPAAAS